ncbi:MAG: LamG-like jellyroll fold domain-containing protein [Kineosporiaceae bacterium]
MAAAALGAAGIVAIEGAVAAPPAQAVPAGFQDQVLWTGFTAPTEIAFAPDGAVFVAEKSGLVHRFDDLADTTRQQVADLRTAVHNWADRGLLGLAVDPEFGPDRPYLYVQYTYDHVLGDPAPAPRWGTAGETFDSCPTPPGGTADGCVTSGRLSKLVLDGVTGSVVREDVLVEDWCAQSPSHSIGTIAFGADGYLYAGGGDGASYNVVDYGQLGGTQADTPTPVNPCGDGVPPGTAPTPADAVGGALRSQAPGVRARSTVTGDVSLSGTIIRIDPDTGAGVPGNPWFDLPGATPNEQRIVAYGMRNQFRFSFRGGTNELWIGDVGWGVWEEINVLPDPGTLDAPPNFGWPCYEGAGRQSGYDGGNLDLCEDLYAAGDSAVTAPYYAYRHSDKPVASDPCPTGASSIAGVAYYDRPTSPGITPYPESYDGAVFFTDYNRRCIWALLPGADGRPDPNQVEFFHQASGGIVNLVVGPNGDLFYPNVDLGQIHRIGYFPDNTPPVASLTADRLSGPAPLTVALDASGSTDADGDALAYAWDLDGDGEYDDATGPTASGSYTAPETTVTVQVSDARGAVDLASVTVTTGNGPPAVDITAPDAATTWAVGDAIDFAATASDPEDGELSGDDVTWQVRLLTCDATGEDCVTRRVDPFTGTSGTVIAPDWSGEGNTLLELEVTATDSSGATAVDRVRLQPRTVTLTFDSEPQGLGIVVGSDEPRATPFTRTVIVGSENSFSAPSPQTLSDTTYEFASWADGSTDAARLVAAPADPVTYTARFDTVAPTGPTGLVAEYGFDEAGGTAVRDSSGRGNDGTADNTTRTSSGRFGAALSFDGAGSRVVVPDAASLDLTSGMTLSAWVAPTTSDGWRTAVLKEDPARDYLVYGLYSSEPGAGPGGYVRIGGRTTSATGTTALPTGAWSHLTTTYDGATVRTYVNGALAASRAATGSMADSTGPLTIGGNAIWGEWFAGRIDEVRVYDRALTADEVLAERDRPTTPLPPDTTAPTVAITSPSAGATVAGTVAVTADATDDRAVAAVEFRAGSTVLGTDTAAPWTVAWDAGALPDGPVTLTAVARDSAGNASAPAGVAVTVDNPDTPTRPGGLVAGYAFDETSGTAVGDASGLGNAGTAAGTTRAGGRFGGALAFDGAGSRVTVPDSASLDLRTGMTVMAWVNPTAVSDWRTVVLKEDPARSDLAYGLYAASPSRGAGGWVVTGSTTRSAENDTRLAAGAWTHVAMTYDGTILRYFQDGAQVASTAGAGAVPATTGPLVVGSNSVWGEPFAGLIDEVEVYDRALSPAEIAAARDAPL